MRAKKPQLPCAECSIVFESKSFRKFCTLQCADRYHTRNKLARKAARVAEQRSIPRPCTAPGCTKTFTGSPAKKYCSPKCGWSVANGQPELRRRQSIPRPCARPECGNLFTGNLQRKFCSSRCNQLVNHKRPTIEYEKRLRDNKTAKNIAISPPCSICGKTTARQGYMRPKPNPMTPEGMDLCIRHSRGYKSFISWNNYEGLDREEVFAAYLIRLTFISSTRQESMVMMREAFHANCP